jgi:hypothetical protein
MIKANFKITKNTNHDLKNENNPVDNKESIKDLTKSEFEEFMMRSGAAGSFMVFRSNKKEEELGLDEL